MKTKKYTPEQVERMKHRQGCMSCMTQPGMKVVFTNPNAGYDRHVQTSKELGLEVGAVYTVESISAGQSSTSLSLKEFPNVGFNSVQFCNTPRQKLPETSVYATCYYRRPTPQPEVAR